MSLLPKFEIPLIYKLGAIALAISLAVAYYFYSQNKINTLQTNVDKYKGAAEQSDKVVKALQINSKEQFKQTKILNDKYVASQVENDRLNKIFSSHNFAELIYKKPGLIEKRINDATQNIFDELAKLSQPDNSNTTSK